MVNGMGWESLFGVGVTMADCSLLDSVVCEKMKVEVKEGLPGVQGAKYRFHMSFREGIGLLLPNPDRQIPKSVWQYQCIAQSSALIAYGSAVE